MIGCVEFTFNASFFLFGVALFLFGVVQAELVRPFLNLYKLPVASLLNLGNISMNSSYIIDFQAIGISKKH